MRPPFPTLILAAAILATAAPPALAQTVPAAAQPEVAPTGPFGTAAVSDGALERIAGREDLRLVATSQQVAGVSNNSVGSNSRTGQVTIGDNAFQNLSGFSLVNVNSGNNVAINSAMNVTISIAPAP